MYINRFKQLHTLIECVAILRTHIPLSLVCLYVSIRMLDNDIIVNKAIPLAFTTLTRTRDLHMRVCTFRRNNERSATRIGRFGSFGIDNMICCALRAYCTHFTQAKPVRL